MMRVRRGLGTKWASPTRVVAKGRSAGSIFPALDVLYLDGIALSPEITGTP
jgi:hypothetical protein